MLNETYRAMLNNKSVIRETFMYGRQRAAQIGSENVFDYSLGNPSVPCPPEFTEAMQTLLAQEEPVSLHGYCPSQGDPGFRTAVAAHLTETFGLPYAQKHIFPTTGAAGAIAHAIRAVTQPGDEVLTFAPYFPEYGPYVAGTGAVLRVVPPQAPTFQPNLDAFAQMLTEKVTCVLINTPNNPTGVVYSADTLTRMAAILTEKSAQYGHNIFLVSDEPYRDIVFDGKTVPYPAAFYPPHPDLLLLLQEPEPARRASGLCGGAPGVRRRGHPCGHDEPDLPLYRPQLPAQHHPAGGQPLPEGDQRPFGLPDQHGAAVRKTHRAGL